jgi:hypothetical protein
MDAVKQSRVGPLTLACGLIGSGILLLLHNFGVLVNLDPLLRLWPLLLIGAGIEYFVKRYLYKDQLATFHIPSLLLIILLILAGATALKINNHMYNLLQRITW